MVSETTNKNPWETTKTSNIDTKNDVFLKNVSTFRYPEGSNQLTETENGWKWNRIIPFVSEVILHPLLILIFWQGDWIPRDGWHGRNSMNSPWSGIFCGKNYRLPLVHNVKQTQLRFKIQTDDLMTS